MKLIKKSAIALALSAVSFGAFAMTSIDDAALSQVSGQDGVSIVADLNIHIGSFEYSNKANTGGTYAGANNGTTATTASVSFNDIRVNGGFIMTIDVLSANAFEVAAVTSIAGIQGARGITGVNPQILAGAISTALGRAPGTSDVVQFAFPVVTGQQAEAHDISMNIAVDSIRTGNGGASFGGVALNKFDLQGTKVWMFGH